MKKIKVTLMLFGMFSSVLLSSQQLMDQLIGVDCDARDPIERVDRFSLVRNYHDFSKDTGYRNFNQVQGEIACPPQFNLRYAPSNDGSDYYSFDEFYSKMAGRNSASLKGTHPDMVGCHDFNLSLFEMKPICTPEMNDLGDLMCNENLFDATYLNAIPNALDPAIYISHTKWVTMYAARFGSTSYDLNSDYVENFLIPNLYDPDNDPSASNSDQPKVVKTGCERNNLENEYTINDGYSLFDSIVLTRSIKSFRR